MCGTKIIIIIIISFLLFSLFNDIFYENDNFFNTINSINMIDAYIYINLENREDRKKLILQEFKKMGVAQENIYKISGINIPKNGHKGNVQSFILAITLAKLNKWKTIMICEDDMELIISSSEYKRMIKYMFETFESNNVKWDCIMLGQQYGTLYDTNMKDIKRIKNAQTKTCIIIPEHMYDIFLENFNESNNLMSKDKLSEPGFEKYSSDIRWKVLQENYNFYCFTNNIVKQRNIWSSTMRNSYNK